MRTRLLRPPGNLLGRVSIRAGVVLGLTTLLAASSAATVTLTRGPYLQRLTTTAVTIVWNTDVPAACSLAIRPLGGTAAVIQGETGTVCAIPVTNRAPGTQYAYVPRADGVPLDAESVFRTDGPGRPFSFLVVGDSGLTGPDQTAVRDRMLETPPDFLLHTGDMAYPDGAAEDFNPKFFWPYRDLIRHLVFWPCLGNHDRNTDNGAPWRAAFYTPANNPAGSENYYSFDFGNAHFVVLNSNGDTAPGSPQHTFLDRELGASKALWKFVIFHHTIYSSGNHGSRIDIRNSLVPLLDQHGVDVVFMGHDHDYERTLSLRGDQVVGPGAGTVYVTTGGGGGELHPFETENAFTAYKEVAFHYTRVAVDGSTLLLQMIREDGAVRDAMTLGKGPPQGVVLADVSVHETEPDTTFDTGVLEADASPLKRSFLLIGVSGVRGRRVARAKLRFQVANVSGAPSDSGGRLRSIRDCAWDESTMTWNTQPPLQGAGGCDGVLATAGAAEAGSIVEFDVTPAIPGDGTYCFALDTTSSNGVIYNSSEGSPERPSVVIELAP